MKNLFKNPKLLFSSNSLLKKLLLPVFFISFLFLNTLISKVTNAQNLDPDLCTQIPASNPSQYSAEVYSILSGVTLNPGETAMMKVLLQNTGTATWYGDSANCSNQNPFRLGTQNSQDRASIFSLNSTSSQNTYWLGQNRIKMLNSTVKPGELGVFSFIIKAPEKPGIYREIFSPVVEGVTWLDKNKIRLDINVGNVQLPQEKAKLIDYVNESLNLSEYNISGQKKIYVKISEQKMYLKIGETIINTFPVSTGTTRTPTPLGTTKILFKQDVRVGSAKPHYIMPLFMAFRSGGYGIHALPSLANDKGVFWREALNHIGTRRSHGCIRLLPDDARSAYDFAEVGTTVQIVW